MSLFGISHKKWISIIVLLVCMVYFENNETNDSQNNLIRYPLLYISSSLNPLNSFYRNIPTPYLFWDLVLMKTSGQFLENLQYRQLVYVAGIGMKTIIYEATHKMCFYYQTIHIVMVINIWSNFLCGFLIWLSLLIIQILRAEIAIQK